MMALTMFWYGGMPIYKYNVLSIVKVGEQYLEINSVCVHFSKHWSILKKQISAALEIPTIWSSTTFIQTNTSTILFQYLNIIGTCNSFYLKWIEMDAFSARMESKTYSK